MSDLIGQVAGVRVETYRSTISEETIVFVNGHLCSAWQARELAEILKTAAHVAELNEATE